MAKFTVIAHDRRFTVEAERIGCEVGTVEFRDSKDEIVAIFPPHTIVINEDNNKGDK